MAVILGVVGFLGINNLGKMKTDMDFMYDERLIPINEIAGAQVLYQRIRVNIRDMNYAATTAEENKYYEDRIKEIRKELDGKIETSG
jgi:methyl-accepting chemotaxis protein